jgi:hypothetical protein
LADVDHIDAFERNSAVEYFMRMFFNPRTRRGSSAERIADALRFYAQQAGKVTTEKGLALNVPPVDPVQITKLGRKPMNGQQDDKSMPSVAALAMAQAMKRLAGKYGDLDLARHAKHLEKQARASLARGESALSNSEASNERHSPQRKSANRGIGVSDRMPRYKVMVDDNFHYQKEDERTEQGVYDTMEDAIAACRAIVDQSLEEWQHRPGISAKELYDLYVLFGDDPFVVVLDGGDERAEFSAWNYANERCQIICQKQSPIPQAAAKEPAEQGG